MLLRPRPEKTARMVGQSVTHYNEQNRKTEATQEQPETLCTRPYSFFTHASTCRLFPDSRVDLLMSTHATLFAVPRC